MEGPKALYTRDLNRKFGYFPTWYPGDRVAVGDIGFLEKNTFSRVTSLRLKDVNYRTTQTSAPADLDYTSSGSVSIHFKSIGSPALPGSALDVGKAGVTIDFGNKAGIVLQASGCIVESIKDQETLARSIIKKWNAGQWETKYAVITEVIVAEAGTVIISNGQNSKIELEADANLSAGALKLADISIGLRIASERNIATKVIARSGMTPFFKAMGIRTSLFTPPELKARGFVSSESCTRTIADETIFFGPIPFDDEQVF